METTIFIFLLWFVLCVTIVEAIHDRVVIEFSYPGIKGKWKVWGNIYELAWIMAVSGLVAWIFKTWSPLLWVPTLWMVRWIVHDCVLGKLLTKDWFYLGTTGFDELMGRIFLNGLIYFVWKIVILVLLIGTYFSIKS